MSNNLSQSKAVLVIALMYNDESSFNGAFNALSHKFGKIDLMSDEFMFSHSHYYKNEMGDNLIKRFVVFENLIKRDYLPKVKRITDKIEKKYLNNKKFRTINIDPAILTLENFILATNKNFTHRIYLKNNVFADLTLIYQKKKGFIDLPWTYADYSQETTKKFLENVRSRFYDELLKTSPFNGRE